MGGRMSAVGPVSMLGGSWLGTPALISRRLKLCGVKLRRGFRRYQAMP
jgi:hypothetical protein